MDFKKSSDLDLKTDIIYTVNADRPEMYRISKNRRPYLHFCTIFSEKKRLNPVLRGGVKQEIKGFPYFIRCRRATDLPLALGFGIKEKADIDFIKGQAQIAVVGSEMLRIIDQKGLRAIAGFIHGLE